MSDFTTVYGLRAPGDGYRYVGQTRAPLHTRLAGHLAAARMGLGRGHETPLYLWVGGHHETIEIVPLERCASAVAAVREEWWIRHLGTHVSQGLGFNVKWGNRHAEPTLLLLGDCGRVGGVKGMHNRWHVARGITNPDCALCA